jgi:hypothetical protein
MSLFRDDRNKALEDLESGAKWASSGAGVGTLGEHAAYETDGRHRFSNWVVVACRRNLPCYLRLPWRCIPHGSGRLPDSLLVGYDSPAPPARKAVNASRFLGEFASLMALNPYAYTGSNPINLIDTSGKRCAAL